MKLHNICLFGHRIRTLSGTAFVRLFRGVSVIGSPVCALGQAFRGTRWHFGQACRSTRWYLVRLYARYHLAPLESAISRGGVLHWLAASAVLVLIAPGPAAPGAQGPAGTRPAAQDGQTSRPRRTTDTQDDKPIKLSTDLVTVLASVYDSTGNHANNLTRDDFQIFEDNKPQDIQGLYREDQVPLKLVFLFDTSLSIKHRFDFEQRAAAQFFRQVMRPGDQAAILSVRSEERRVGKECRSRVVWN